MVSFRRIRRAVLIGCMVGISVFQHPVTGQTGYPRVAPRENERCAICNTPLTQDDTVLLVRGRRMPLKQAMVDSFMQNQARFMAKVQPQSALFQESLQTPGTAQGGVSGGWFVAGMLVLLALVSGGAAAYLAVCKGLPAAPYFVAGLVLNVLGVALVLARRSQAEGTQPNGLCKVALTAAPAQCPDCGASNHPAAAKCSGCGRTLIPAVQPETARL